MNPQYNYDFIMNPGQAPKKSRFSGFGGSASPNKRLFMLGGIVGLLFVVFFVALLFKGGGSAANLTSVAQTQTEIVRVATEGSNSAATTANQNMAINVELTLTSQLQTLQNFLKSNGSKELSQKTLNLKKNATTDTQLTTAQQDSTYDVVFAKIMQTDLSNYLSELKTAYNADKGPKTRAMLSTDYTQAAELYEQIPSSATLSGTN
jgi:hypothetical protein